VVVEDPLDLAPPAPDQERSVLRQDRGQALVPAGSRHLPPLQQHPQLDQTALALPRCPALIQTPNQVPDLQKHLRLVGEGEQSQLHHQLVAVQS